ncbi:MAG: flavin reductase family protein [Thermoplasmata archaeon]|nr:flavin reductase family protein [Thermoplasmata archaeon]
MTKEEVENLRLGLRNMPAFPVCLITVGKGKEANIITAAMVHVFSFEPPLIGIGIALQRHSHGLLDKEEDFVVNVPGKDLVKETLACGTVSGKEVDKFGLYGLVKTESCKVSAPSISQCPVNFECKKVQKVTTGDHDWFIGEVVAVMVDKKYKRGDGLLYWGGEFRLPGKIIKER